MYLLYDAETGAITGYSETEPQEGAWATIPFSAMQAPPLTHWSEAAKGFVDGAGSLEWNGTAFVADLNALKLAKWQAVKKYRNQIQWGGCNTPSGIFDTDAESQAKVTGAVTMAQIALLNNQPFSIVWTLANNSTQTLSAAQMIAAGVAVGTFVATCHAVGAGLRAQIIAATSIEELNAIDIAGAAWPS